MRDNRIFWGWYVVAGAFLVLAINYGVRYCFGIFLKPMSEEYGWSRSVISISASINMFVYSIGAVFVGKLIDRIAPRWIITTGALVLALSLVLTAFVATPLQFYLVYGLLCGAGASGMSVVVGNSSVGKWFHRKRGMAIGITTMGISFGTIALTPVAGYVVKVYSWQEGFIFLGVITFLVSVSLSQILLRRTNPEACGLLPDGDAKEHPGYNDINGRLHENAISHRELMKDSRFIVIAVSFSLAVMALMSVFVHQVAYAMDHGIEKIAAASSLGAVSMAGFAGQFFYGWMSDRIRDAKYSAGLGFIFMAAGMCILMKADSTDKLFLYAMVFGFGYGCLAPMSPILLADRFGRHVLGSVYGLVTFFIGLGGSIGPILGGLIYDRTGSYVHVWQLNILVLIGAAVLVLMLKPGTGSVSQSLPDKGDNDNLTDRK